MPAQKRSVLDYRVAQVVEVLTRKSTEEEDSTPSLRWYARFLETGERNLYKLLQRALSLGFRFSVSVNYRRMGVLRAFALADEEPRLPVPVRAVYKTLDGRFIVDFHVPQKCVSNIVEILDAAGVDYELVGVEWGGRPALASIPFLSLQPSAEVSSETIEKMSSLVRDLLARGPPASIIGRKYPVDRVGLAVLAKAMEDSMESVANIASQLGLPPSKAQRKYYSMWQRRIIMGYSISCAPYCGENVVFARVEHGDPARFAYSIAVLPPVLSAMVTVSKRGDARGILLRLAGGGSLVSSALQVVRRYWGNVVDVMIAYPVRVDGDYARRILDLTGDCGLR